jgi:hypothetical protein
VFADDGAFAFGSRRDIELGARILYDHCVRWGMMPHTAGKTVATYFGQPVANLRKFLPDEAIPPIKMGDGEPEAPVVQEFKYLGSMLSEHFDDSVTIMARIRLARIALTKLQKAIFGTRRVALESKKITYESLVLSLLLYGSECWVVSAENMRLLQRSTGNVFGSCAGSLVITLGLGSITSRPRNWRRSWASTTSGIMLRVIRGC